MTCFQYDLTLHEQQSFKRNTAKLPLALHESVAQAVYIQSITSPSGYFPS